MLAQCRDNLICKCRGLRDLASKRTAPLQPIEFKPKVRARTSLGELLRRLLNHLLRKVERSLRCPCEFNRVLNCSSHDPPIIIPINEMIRGSKARSRNDKSHCYP